MKVKKKSKFLSVSLYTSWQLFAFFSLNSINISKFNCIIENNVSLYSILFYLYIFNANCFSVKKLKLGGFLILIILKKKLLWIP